MSSNFNSQAAKKELFGIFVENEIDITTDEYNNLVDEIILIVEDVYYKGYEKGKVVSVQTIREVDADVEKDLENKLDTTTLEELELFSTEPE